MAPRKPKPKRKRWSRTYGLTEICGVYPELQRLVDDRVQDGWTAPKRITAQSARLHFRLEVIFSKRHGTYTEEEIYRWNVPAMVGVGSA